MGKSRPLDDLFEAEGFSFCPKAIQQIYGLCDDGNQIFVSFAASFERLTATFRLSFRKHLRLFPQYFVPRHAYEVYTLWSPFAAGL